MSERALETVRPEGERAVGRVLPSGGRAPEGGLRPWSTALFVVTLGATLWAPIAFGSVEPWAVGLLRLAACVSAALLAVGWAAKGRVVLSANAVQLAVFGGAALAYLQTVVLPWESSPASVDPYATRQAAVTLVAFGVLLSAALVALDTRSRLLRASQILFWFGFGLSVFAIVQGLSGTTRMFWVREVAHGFFGTFVNRNHYAGLMELLIPLGLGAVVAGAVPRSRAPLTIFAVVVMAVSVALSGSRGGLFSLAAGLVMLGLLAVTTLPTDSVSRGRAIVFGALGGIALAGGIALGVFWLGAEPVAASFSDLPDQMTSESGTERSGIWTDTLALARERPWLGSGVGAYGTAFTQVTRSNGSARVLQAHNDYLQVVADAGAFGVLLSILFLVALGYSAWRGVRRRDPVIRGAAVGAAAGCFGLLTHSLVDFNLQIPSNALAFLFVASICARAAVVRGGDRRVGA